MSVIVKGMEMPKYCYDCPLQDGETGRCNILGITVYDYIPKECPLVEVIECKDCKHVRTFDINPDRYHCEFTPGYTHCAGGFCEKGERKEDVRKPD